MKAFCTEASVRLQKASVPDYGCGNQLCPAQQETALFFIYTHFKYVQHIFVKNTSKQLMDNGFRESCSCDLSAYADTVPFPSLLTMMLPSRSPAMS
jgi:hypothetical protein